MDFLSIRTGMRKRESPDATWPPLRFSATQLQSKKIAFLRQKNLNKIESAQDKDKASGSRLNPPILPFTSRRKPQKKYFSSGQSRFHELHKHFIALNFRSMMMFNKPYMGKTILTGLLLLFSIGPIFAQETNSQNMATGVVLDADDNQPIPGTSIVPKGTKGGTQAGQDGRFMIFVGSVPTLQISSAGYKPVEVNISGNKTNIRVLLKRMDE